MLAISMLKKPVNYTNTKILNNFSLTCQNAIYYERIVKNQRYLSSSASSEVKPKVHFYYDVGSPYSWLAFEVLNRYVEPWNIDLKLKPIWITAIFKATENHSPLLSNPAKLKFLMKDLHRGASECNVDMKMLQNPSELFTKGTLQPMRCLTAVNQMSPQHLEEVSREFWKTRYSLDQDFTTNDAIESILTAHIKDKSLIEEIRTKITSQEIKDKLREETQIAVDNGTFGVPTIYVPEKDELFFGSDRFSHLAKLLGKEWKGPNPK